METILPEPSCDYYYGIKYQRQPTPSTCVQACIAMALSSDVKDVVDIYGSEPMNQELLGMVLTRCGVMWNQFVHGTMIWRGWYFAVVPSLNKVGANHQILIHWDNELHVMDPAIGTRYNSNGEGLISWNCLIPFIPGGVLR